MRYLFQPLSLGNLPVAIEHDRANGLEAPTLSDVIVSLSLAALTLSLAFAAVLTVIVWVAG